MNSTMLFAIVSCQSYFWFKFNRGITINIHLSNFIGTFQVFNKNVIFDRNLFFSSKSSKNHLKIQNFVYENENGPKRSVPDCEIF